MLKSPSLPDAFIGLGRNRMSLVNRCFHTNICLSFLGYGKINYKKGLNKEIRKTIEEIVTDQQSNGPERDQRNVRTREKLVMLN